jgi:hypothetical protein
MVVKKEKTYSDKTSENIPVLWHGFSVQNIRGVVTILKRAKICRGNRALDILTEKKGYGH